MATKITNKQVKVISNVNFNNKEIENAIIDATKNNIKNVEGINKVDDVLVNGTSVVENKVANVNVPTKTSELDNDSGYITNAVEDLINYPTTTVMQNADIILQEQIDQLESRGRFLSLWDCILGLAQTNPPVSPYEYKAGDYFIVGNIGLTNYKPTGNEYTTGVASTVIETGDVQVNDVYFYDGTSWLLQENHNKEMGFSEIVGDPYSNTNLATALNAKQDTLVSGTNIKTVNGNNLLGNGNIAIKTYQPFNSSWTINSTTAQLCSDIDNDSSAVAGMAYLGILRNSDLPNNMMQADAVVEIIGESGGSKVIHITITSADQYPYRWEYSYFNEHSVNGWVGFQPELVSGTNIKTINGESILGTGDLEIKNGSELFDIKTILTADAEANKGWACTCYDEPHKLNENQVAEAYHEIENALNEEAESSFALDNRIDISNINVTYMFYADGYYYFVYGSEGQYQGDIIVGRTPNIDGSEMQEVVNINSDLASSDGLSVLSCNVIQKEDELYFVFYVYNSTTFMNAYTLIYDKDWNLILRDQGDENFFPNVIAFNGILGKGEYSNKIFIPATVFSLSDYSSYLRFIIYDIENGTYDTELTQIQNSINLATASPIISFYNNKILMSTSSSIISVDINNNYDINTDTIVYYTPKPGGSNGNQIIGFNGELYYIISMEISTGSVFLVYKYNDEENEWQEWYIDERDDSEYTALMSIQQHKDFLIIDTNTKIYLSRELNDLQTLTEITNYGNLTLADDKLSVSGTTNSNGYSYFDIVENKIPSTDTYNINGEEVEITYYKCGNYKICVAGENNRDDGEDENDSKLQDVYEYLGYLPYFWIDTENLDIVLPRNNNRWTMMYVGNNYVEEEMPEGNYSAFATKDELKDLKVFNLFDIKTMSERIASKGWSCISYDTQNKLDKADVPTAYDFLEDKYKNVDGAMSEPTAISGTIAQVFHDGWYYYISSGSIYRSQYVDLSSPELFYNNIDSDYNRLLMKVEFSNKAYIMAYRYQYPTFYCKVIDLETKQLVKTNNVTVSDSFDDYSCLSHNSSSIFVVDNIGYMLFTYGASNDLRLVLFKIEDDGTVSLVFFKYNSDIFYKGFPNDHTILSSRFKNCCLFNNKIYLSFGGMIWLWYDIANNTFDYSMDMITNYGQYETYVSYGTIYYRNGDSVIFVYDNKLSILACSYDGNTLYFMQLNNNTWNLVNTIDISSQRVEINNSAYNFTANTIYDGYYYFAFKLYNQNKWVVYKTSDFSNSNLTYACDTSYTIHLILINENDFSYIVYGGSGYQQYIYSEYTRTIYTDTYTINGSSVVVSYYKNEDWKICTPEIDVDNDTNLQMVYEYLGYLNYWWIDTTNEQITLQRNSNMWTMMYVGDDYEDDVLPTGQFEGIATKEELRELIPDQTGNNGKFLTTNGTTTSWAEVQGGGCLATLNFFEGSTGTTLNTNLDLGNSVLIFKNGIGPLESGIGNDYVISGSTITFLTPLIFTDRIGVINGNISSVDMTGYTKIANFINISVLTTDWIIDDTYANYGFKCVISGLLGVTANSFAQVIFAPTEADSGNYSTVCETGNGTITIYSKVDNAITIPNIVIMEA